MLNENTIRSLSLPDRQKLVVDLKNVQAGDKYYEAAQRIIRFTEETKGYKPAPIIRAKNIAGHDLELDGKNIGKDSSVSLFPWQYVGLARYFEVENEKETADILESYLRKPEKGEADKNPQPVQLGEDQIAKIVAATIKALGVKVAALLLFVSLMFGARNVFGQTQTYAIGSPSVYNVQYVGQYNGTTSPNANVIVTTNLLTLVTNTLSIITNANWTIVNGVATNAYTITTNTVVNQPGVVSIANYIGTTLIYSGQMMAGTTNVNSNVTVDYSGDAVYWQSNKWTLPITMIGTGQVTTTLDLSFTYGGYLRFNTITMAANVPETNVLLEVVKKPYNTGP